ncbi:protein lifeguard 1-like [Aphis craccivora]|uniref:Protein lifeguard 1-like n=1 Tax=Aphis craccivora TaxID=307492 RepID=A0A6G0YMF9_APHCR|nr:protein lifeguard 1-like [Aphis craccivora]
MYLYKTFKVYSIVMCQLITATAFMSMATFHEPTRIILKSHPCLSIITTLSFLLAVSVSQYYPNQVLLALGIATIICFALIIFALQTKIDFTVMDILTIPFGFYFSKPYRTNTIEKVVKYFVVQTYETLNRHLFCEFFIELIMV